MAIIFADIQKTQQTASAPAQVVRESLFVDAIITEGFSETATITDNPAEEGVNFSDHIRPDPEKLKLTIVISNSPMQAVTEATGFVSQQLVVDELGTQRLDVNKATFNTLAEEAFAKLIRWRNSGALLSFVTTMGPRQSMALEGIDLQRDAKTGGPPRQTGGARINLALKEIRVVSNKQTTIKVSKDLRNSNQVKNGAQPTTPVDKDSPLLRGIDGVLNTFTGSGFSQFEVSQ